MKPTRLLVMAVLVSAAACSSNGGEHRASQPTSTTRASTPQPTTPQATTPQTTRPRAIEFTASYTCGPGDGPWIDVKVTLDQSADVMAKVRFRDRYFGASDLVHARSGQAVTFGFNPVLPGGFYGRTGKVTLFATSGANPRSVTERTIPLRLAAGMGCG